MTEIVLKEESYAIMGACFDVYREMGCGFLEPVYQECLELELAARGVPFVPQADIKLTYKGRELRHFYTPDFICYSSVIVEIKALSNLDDVHRAQVHNYLKGSGFRLGLLVNFGHFPKVQSERIVR